MNITDEQLSAFLDAELPAVEMEVIREQLLEDESLADRLAELALVDELVAASAKQIDVQPVPQAITALLQPQSATAQVIAFPLWKRVQKTLQQPLAIAASVALVVGFGAVQMMNGHTSHNDWAAVARVLEVAPSGLAQLADNGAQVKPRLSFKNHQGEFCRQFDMSKDYAASENIACRSQGQWQLLLSIEVQSQDSGNYQTASGGSAVDDALDKLAQGDALNAKAEADAIAKSWLVKP